VTLKKWFYISRLQTQAGFGGDMYGSRKVGVPKRIAVPSIEEAEIKYL
jgi:hypothetical protein